MSLGLLEGIKIQLRYVRSALTTAKSQSGRHNIVLRDVCFGFGVLVPPSAVDSSQTPPDANVCDNSPCGQKCMRSCVLQG